MAGAILSALLFSLGMVGLIAMPLAGMVAWNDVNPLDVRVIAGGYVAVQIGVILW